MPRDISGNYTLPAVTNPVVDGTIISSNWANGTLSDIATQLNNVLTRDGILGPTQPVGFTDGSILNPSISFASQVNLGIYRAANNTLALVNNGSEALKVGDSVIANRKLVASKQAYCPTQTATYAAALTIDAANGNVWTVSALTGNVTSFAITNMADGQSIQVRFVQDATGNRTVALPAGAKIDGAISLTPNQASMFFGTYFSLSGRIEGNWLQVPL